MRADYVAKGTFQLGISDDNRYQKGDPLKFSLTVEDQRQTIPIPLQKLNRKQNIHWSLLCPNQKSEIVVKQFQLLSDDVQASNTSRALWVWQPRAWMEQSKKLITLLQKYNANRVFISIGLNEKADKIIHQNKLKKFITNASSHNIDVWAVEGDPHATLPSGQKQFVRRAKLLSQYNEEVSSSARLKGVQYDIEPYLVKGWSLAQEQWFAAYVETLRRVKNELNIPVEIVIPFWWQFKTLQGEPLLDAVKPHIDSINVMNYRTDVALIKKFAQPFLDWGEASGKKVSIALEAGPITDEQRWYFRKAKQGSLWHVKTLSQPMLLLLDKNKSVNNIDVFALFDVNSFKGDIVSFQADPSKLIELLPKLESLWRLWPSFSGISLHGYEDEL